MVDIARRIAVRGWVRAWRERERIKSGKEKAWSMDETAYDRFIRYVSPCPVTGCWWWMGAVSPAAHGSGYGVFQFKGKRHFATRFSYEYHSRASLGDLFACHKCDQPLCVNPDHLFPGTHSANMKDAFQKGRLPMAKFLSDRYTWQDDLLFSGDGR